jgi:hypothetical protein
MLCSPLPRASHRSARTRTRCRTRPRVAAPRRHSQRRTRARAAGCARSLARSRRRALRSASGTGTGLGGLVPRSARPASVARTRLALTRPFRSHAAPAGVPPDAGHLRACRRMRATCARRRRAFSMARPGNGPACTPAQPRAAWRSPMYITYDIQCHFAFVHIATYCYAVLRGPSKGS